LIEEDEEDAYTNEDLTSRGL
jgi:hypothetical protein